MRQFLVISLLLGSSLKSATVLPPGFSEALVADVGGATAINVAPDGRIFVCEKNGALRVIKNNVLLPTPFTTIAVDTPGERGLLGIAFDPDFASNQYLYVYYTTAAAPIHNRISRFTANGDVAAVGSEFILMDLENLTAATNHNGGALHFGPDNKLYAAVGENATGSNSQTLANRLGKILRLNNDGSIPTDNPFYGTATGLNRSIWALGLRNPFTFNFHRTSGRMFINDVGQGTWEEINEGFAGANYGWPTTEGMFNPVTYPNFTLPRYVYSSLNPPECAIVGGAFYDPPVAQFPASYLNKYFFADYCAGWVSTLDTGTYTSLTFVTGSTLIVDLAVDPTNGTLLYYRANGNVVRVSYTGSLAPYISSQPAPLTVTAGSPATFCVSGGGSPMPGIQWQRGGVDIAGATSTCYTLNPALLSDDLAQFRAILSNANGSITSTAATLYVNSNQPPSPTVISPTASALYSAGQNYFYIGDATDPEDGALPAASLTWNIVFHHDLHTHPFLGPLTGTSGSFTVPNIGEYAPNVWFRLSLTAVDSLGLSATVQRDFYPNLVTFTVATSPSGLTVTVDGIPSYPSPIQVLGVAGMLREIGAPSPQGPWPGLAFQSWSDAGAQVHFITASAAAYTASFAAIPSPSPTPTPTSTGSPTATPSPSPSHTATQTPSPTLTATDSFTFSPTLSPQPSGSVTFSPSITLSFSPSPQLSPTPTETPSPSDSPTGTPSATPSESETATPSPTPSETSLPSATASPSAVLSASHTLTPAPSPSASPSLTRSPTPSASPSPNTGMVTVNVSGFSFNPSSLTITAGTTVHWQGLSPGHNVAQVDTDTDLSYNGGFRSGNLSAVPTFDFTFNSAGTFYYICEAHAGFNMRGVVFVLPAPTATPAPSQGEPEILEVLAVPNPNPASFQFKVSAAARQIRLQVFSSGMSKVAELSGPGPNAAGWAALDASGLSLGNGTYYFKAQAGNAELKASKLPPGKFSILK